MQRFAVALALCSLALFARPNEANAGGFQLGIDLGVDYALEDLAGIGIGVGFNPGYEIIDGLAIELNLGLDRFSKDSFRTRLLPLQIGARYRAELDSITPFGYLHFGPVNVNIKPQGLGIFGAAFSVSNTYIGVNAGGGVEFALNENTGIGAQVGVSHVFVEREEFTNINVGLVFLLAL
ncbi:MAG: opacity protein-like surface antigen [Bradymonadia bacterium]|jgi:hypothetical protein